MNLPNALTLSRIFIVPLLVVVLLTPVSENWLGAPQYILGVAIFVAAALTDYFDGKIARQRQQVSKLGKLLDPIADKLLISAALISLVENHRYRGPADPFDFTHGRRTARFKLWPAFPGYPVLDCAGTAACLVAPDWPRFHELD